MKEFIEKLKAGITEVNEGVCHYCGCDLNSAAVTDTIDHVAEEYKDKLGDEWQIIYNKILNLEKKYANDGNTESVNDCIKLENLLQYFKEELRSEEEYINTSTDTSSGWISCSERLPDVEADVLLSLRSLDIYTGFRATTSGCFYVDGEGYVALDNVIAWQPLPEPYKIADKPQEN